MKSLSPLVTALITIVTLFACPTAFAKKQKPTFSDFKGSYTGTVVFVTGGVAFNGPASIAFGTNKSGKSATVNVSGSFVAGGTTYHINGVIGLAKGAFSLDSIFFHIFGPTQTPATGSYTRTKRAISFQGAYTVNPTFTVVGNIATATRGHKQQLAFTYVLSQSGSPAYSFTFDVSRHVKKK